MRDNFAQILSRIRMRNNFEQIQKSTYNRYIFIMTLLGLRKKPIISMNQNKIEKTLLIFFKS